MTLVRLGHVWHRRPKLRILPIETALKFCGADLAAGQRHGLENPLVTEFRFLIRLFARAAIIASVLLVSIRVFLHKSPRVLDRLWGSSRDRFSNTLSESTTRQRRIGWDCWFPGDREPQAAQAVLSRLREVFVIQFSVSRPTWPWVALTAKPPAL